MKIKGIKRGKIIELLEKTSLEDGTQVSIEISDSPSDSQEHSASEQKSTLHQDYFLWV
jgi:hypothetical protein